MASLSYDKSIPETKDKEENSEEIIEEVWGVIGRDDEVEDVVGILFDSLEDQHAFFSQFEGVGEDGKSVPIEGTPIMLSEDESILTTVYFFKSKGDGIKNDINAFINEEYLQFAIESNWVKPNVVRQYGVDVKSKEFLKRVLREIMEFE